MTFLENLKNSREFGTGIPGGLDGNEQFWGLKGSHVKYRDCLL